MRNAPFLHIGTTAPNQPACHLDRGFVCYWCDALRLVVLRGDSPGFTGHCWLTLEMNMYTLRLGLAPLGGILLDTSDELFT